MTRKGLAALVFIVVLSAVLAGTGCTCKKELATIADQEARLGEANGRIDTLQQEKADLDKQLGETRTALEAARAKSAETSSAVESMTGQIAAMETRKAELEKELASGKLAEETSRKRVRHLNATIAGLTTEVQDKETAISAARADISSLQEKEANLRTAAAELEKKIAALSGDKDALASTVASRGRVNTILAVLLGLAVLAAVILFFKGRKRG